MLNDLFRRGLEYEEVIPSPSVGKNLMRKVGIREFLRFNPARMNIWYAGAAVIAGTSLAIILFSGSAGDTNSKDTEPVEIQTGAPVSRIETDVPDIQTQRSGVIENEISDDPARSEISKRLRDAGTALPTGSTAGETEKVTIFPSNGIPELKSGDDKKLKLFTGSGSYIWTSVIDGCCPLQISFKCLAAPYDSCVWNFGDDRRSVVKDPVWLFDREGEYLVTLEVFSSGARHISEVTIEVHPVPTARFEIIRESQDIHNDEVIFRNYSEGARKYRWNFGDGTSSDVFEPKHTYVKDGSYNTRLIAVSENGCIDSAVVKYVFSSSGCIIEFPNAFIPNPDGPTGGNYNAKSDEESHVFHPVCSGVRDYQLRIYTRRGILVFESNDINYGWDGYYKGQLCDPGVYIWKVTGKFINTETFTKMGDVTLLKN